MRPTTTLQRVFLGLVALLVVGNAVAALWNLSRVNEHQAAVAHTSEVRATLARIIGLLNEAETGQRGYLLTGERQYLEPYTSASSQIRDRIDYFRSLTADNMEQRTNLDELERRIDARLASLRERLNAYDRLGQEEAIKALRYSNARDEMKAIRALVAEMDQAEARLMMVREPQAESSYRRAVASSITGACLGLGLVGIAFYRLRRDAAFRRQSAEALLEQREWFQTTLASVGDAVIATGTDGCISYMNPVAEALTGWDRVEATGMPLERVFRVLHEITREPVPDPALVALRDGVIVELANHTVLVAKDGVERPIDDSAAPIRHADGTLIGVVLIFRDVTERRRVERERAETLDREQEARRRAEEANRLKDDFLATISHELRTPLNAIIGWSGILRTGEADRDTTRRGLDTIERNARSQARLVEDLLDVSRINEGTLRLEEGVVDLARTVETCVETLRLAADAKGIEMSAAIDPETGQVSGDAGRLRQVILNLVSNAIKFTPAGGTVTVRLGRYDGGVFVSVADTGKGISPEFLPHVFERFRQADSTSSRGHGGVGLGLAIARQLVELHGGTLEAESAGEGMGATFTVRLPSIRADRRRTGPLVSEVAHQPIVLGEDFERFPLDGLRVAVVDDEADAREMLLHVLSHCNAEVRTASSANEGLSLVREWKPDLLISDIGMPDGDGYAFIQMVRSLSDKQGGAVPAIALTAYARAEDRVRVLAAGYQMHVAKPVDPYELIAVISSVIGFHRVQPER